MRSAVIFGVSASLVSVEVDVSTGLPSFTMVGLPDSTIRESRDRVRAAIKNSGFEFPVRRITVNLAPAGVHKRGSSFDLSIAVAILAAVGALPRQIYDEVLLIGELSLDGSIQSTPGVLSMAKLARQRGLRLLTPEGRAREASIVPGIDVGGVQSLAHTVAVLSGRERALAVRPHPSLAEAGASAGREDMSDVKGQRFARRALEIAAAGRHHVLMVGPPGAGKTMMARRLPGLLPPTTFDEALETTTIHSVAGLVPEDQALLRDRPFRAPHHSASDVALVGGGSQPRPGEVSLAHNGVLFLDEMPEFGRGPLEVLRQPLEEGVVRIARAAGVAVFPARFLLVGAMNPCPCGLAGHPSGACACSPSQVARYRARLSAPLRDRFDLMVPVDPVPVSLLASAEAGEPSRSIRARVVRARRAQTQRAGTSGFLTNADLTHTQLDSQVRLTPEAARLLDTAVERFRLSARSFDRIRRVARTIADLDDAECVATPHMSEALSYREGPAET